MKNKKEKVIILGGGLGSLVTAYEITSKPDWQEKYDITIYQLGWRLGGKGASGRNQDFSNRIEEHGLHIWFGFYDHAFQLIRKCYQELGRPLTDPLATWEEAFKPANFFVLEEQINGNYQPWPMRFPMNNQIPGDTTELPDPSVYPLMILNYVNEYYVSYRKSIFPKNDQINNQSSCKQILKWIEDEGVGVDVIEKIIFVLKNLADKLNDDFVHDRFLKIIDLFIDDLWEKVEKKIESNTEARRFWILVDFSLTNIKGIIKDGVLEKGFESIDDFDYREWLKRHGANELTINSAIVQAIYGLVFGGKEQYTFAAGTALKGALRMVFTYKGAVAYRMQAGMGDVIFTPLYEILKKRGVHIKFFHRVRELIPGKSNGQSLIQTVKIGKQVNLYKDEYHPLINVKGLACWPSKPLYDQIEEGEELKKYNIDLENYWSTWQDKEEIVLESGKDFDRIVFGISIGAIPFVCPKILEESSKWKQMTESVTTCLTDAFQLWMYPDIAGLGWKYWKNEPPVLGSYVEPFDTWCDMSHLINRESWPDSLSPNHIAYFCGPSPVGITPKDPLVDPDIPTQMEKLKGRIAKFLEQDIHILWPNSTIPGKTSGFNWDLLLDADKAEKGPRKIESQYVRLNIQPTERYVLSVKGSTKYRLPAGDNGYSNLVITGDWIQNSVLNAGCVESTVVSGIEAARCFS
ncbi:NAD(P)-binding protein [Leptospira borgpetersenii]|uniref:NAD(P)-binding Rossmann-like domain protein n=1 Tax=Leptospira borgpetersenii serovar Ballum TaxID=280505 RepID=A0A0E3AXR9_LEPBO|nr:NAD(P)-binding protein [Leptospira borgpetersenii]EMO08830.1 NAD(P)-binding Rossmann-like domain protein [Leptospira borgpetersenii str. Noumea 25]ALO26016.1 NAD(P)-binding Rossmann-like domain protein [Leptospira borgpetersenii serovar Ballum]ANH00782.1 NAD(P)-binding Rossmann-like domain protein [Leptospira borgpetersenii str. 4E]EKR01910.1 NAD(P)-binding Rossmann-like domain protein [Leptospira borgpetersenii serovar Castellonis str. 200801910]KGE22252.1 membrane protein [Leptospira borg